MQICLSDANKQKNTNDSQSSGQSKKSNSTFGCIRSNLVRGFPRKEASGMLGQWLLGQWVSEAG